MSQRGVRLLVAAAIGLGVLMAGGGPGHALQPDEVLPDRKLEQRARDISLGLRCLVCQNQSIDDSDAQVARDLRRVVRQRLVAGDSDPEIRAYIVERYGDFVLLKPPFNARTFLLWLGPAIVLLCGAAFVLWGRRRSRAATPALNAAEQAQLQKLLDDREPPA